MGRNPGRIDTYLLISNLMRETGGEMAAARMFQYLAQTAPKDDLFTIAIDGILNLRAHRGTRVPISTVRWALRTTLERLAAKPGKFYLYRLVTDLASELNDMQLRDPHPQVGAAGGRVSVARRSCGRSWPRPRLPGPPLRARPHRPRRQCVQARAPTGMPPTT